MSANLGTKNPHEDLLSKKYKQDESTNPTCVSADVSDRPDGQSLDQPDNPCDSQVDEKEKQKAVERAR